ncbi:uncharacterized protein B0P05DRAFT_601374 [Gilbertella persicaria]|uniref:uncharacterized protein n=1 Tax=Gilbertella persicaria TaxID=101096 RepID=UPI00221FB80E|nr:uncharacterized protein B0P05DRAFT_601374 [Gilbertella persicaria]KAI8098241.1 hypothetical protein B0P05DRAFT_601374 [Gilbertella persicaria]
MTDCYNPDPIMLRNPSLLEDNKEQSEIIEITQHLAPELYQYEFPPKSRLLALEADESHENEDYSYFDECSFTTTSTSTAAYSNILYEEDEEEDDYYQHKIPDIDSLLLNDSEQFLNRYFDSFDQPNDNENNDNMMEEMSFVADNQLSPLQLPIQANYDHRSNREESYDSTGTVVIRKPSYQPARPSSFLTPSARHSLQYLERVAEQDRINWDNTSFVFPDYSYPQKGYRSVHPYQCSRVSSEADIFQRIEEEDDDQSHFSTSSKVVVIKISKNMPPQFIHPSSNGSCISTDEGYDDEDDDNNSYSKELPIESASVFLPLSDQEQEHMMDLDHRRYLAAVKIQSVWRGYMGRKQMKSSSLKLSHRVLAGLAQINDSIHRRNCNQLQERIQVLERRLNEETAMRMAFEKAMEDMTILMDHQQHVLHERVEQEVSMRQTYERKMEQVLAQVQPLESRLRHEAKARADLESMMSRVLDQLHDMKSQAREEVEHRKALEHKLDSAVEEIQTLKTKKPTSAVNTTQPSRAVSRLSTASKSTKTQPNTSSRPSTTPLSRPVSRPVSRLSHVNKSSATTTTAATRKTLTPSRLSTRPTESAKPAMRKTIVNRKL